MKHITLIRHAETVANAAGVWQGQGDADLSDLGRRQARALGDRVAGWAIDRVIASDLVRTLRTAELAGVEAQPHPAWREMDIGEWEGLTRDQVVDRFSDDLEDLRSGSDIPMGGGERWSEFSSRAHAAFRRLVDDMVDGERAAVITHGGVIHAVVASVLGMNRGTGPWPLDRVGNTSATAVTVSDEWTEVAVFNDASHLSSEPATGHTEVVLVRHAESEANVRGEWHGATDGPLSKRGHVQAHDLAKRLPAITGLFSSPSERALVTAGALGSVHGREPAVIEGLGEMHVGAWEGRTSDEIRTEFRDEWEAVFQRGEDVARGGWGETFADARLRGRRAVEEVAALHHGERVAVVTHGVLIRAILSDVLGVAWPDARRIGLPGNASRSTIRFDSGGPVMVDHNV